MRFQHELVILSFVFEGETSTMMLQPSLHRLKVLMQLEEHDTELDLGLAQLRQQRRKKRAPRRFWVRTWLLRQDRQTKLYSLQSNMGRAKRIWYLSPMRAAKVQANLRIRAVSPEPPLLAHTSSESRGTFRQKTRSLAPLNGWACAVKI